MVTASVRGQSAAQMAKITQTRVNCTKALAWRIEGLTLNFKELVVKSLVYFLSKLNWTSTIWRRVQQDICSLFLSDPCASIECLSTSVCVLDSERKPHCRCGDTCPSDFQPVCGSDGRSYSSQCHLMQEACRSQRQLRILYKGLCESGMNISFIQWYHKLLLLLDQGCPL